MIAAAQSQIGLSRAKHVGVASEGAHRTAACAVVLVPVIVIPNRTLEQVIDSGKSISYSVDRRFAVLAASLLG